MIYQSIDAATPLSQGDIFDHCPIFGADEVADALAPQAVPTRWFVRAIVLTQACDLAQARTNKVLVAVVHDAAGLVQQGILKASPSRTLASACRSHSKRSMNNVDHPRLRDHGRYISSRAELA
jgi:hypothetical protein